MLNNGQRVIRSPRTSANEIHRRVDTESMHPIRCSTPKLNIEHHQPTSGNNAWIVKLDHPQRMQPAKRSATVPATLAEIQDSLLTAF